MYRAGFPSVASLHQAAHNEGRHRNCGQRADEQCCRDGQRRLTDQAEMHHDARARWDEQQRHVFLQSAGDLA